MTVTRTWYLEINGVPLATPAWGVPDLSPLLDSAVVRGADRLLPGAPGVRANRRRPTVTILTFPLDVLGDVDEDGDPTADPNAGANEHMAYLEPALGFLSEDQPNGLVPAIFHRGSLNDWTADVHFLGFKGSEKLGEFLVRTTFDISIPAGRWEEVGS